MHASEDAPLCAATRGTHKHSFKAEQPLRPAGPYGHIDIGACCDDVHACPWNLSGVHGLSHWGSVLAPLAIRFLSLHTKA